MSFFNCISRWVVAARKSVSMFRGREAEGRGKWAALLGNKCPLVRGAGAKLLQPGQAKWQLPYSHAHCRVAAALATVALRTYAVCKHLDNYGW